MAAVTSTSTYTEAYPALGAKALIVETPTGTDTADTVAITLADYGCTTFLAIQGYVHTTENSVVVAEAPTTAVSAGVLTITVGGSTVSDKKRVYIVHMK